VIFDTGASQSVIALNFVDRYKITYKISNIKRKLRNNVSIPVIGITHSSGFIVFGTICKLKFLILPRNNVLSGCDWFKLVHASVETYNNKLIFRRREISLKHDKINVFENEINMSTCLAVEMDEFEEELLDSWSNKPLNSSTKSFINIHGELTSRIFTRNQYLCLRFAGSETTNRY
jgi:hypothetical protein